MSVDPPATAAQLVDRLASAPTFRALRPDQQEDLRAQAAKVFGYLEHDPRAMSTSTTLAANDPASSGGGTGEQGDLMRRAGSATQGMLNAIDFPSFVASLVQGTFRAIVDSSIQQMEAYSQLLASVSKTVDQFMDEHITDDMAKDHLVENYGGVFEKQLTPSGPTLNVVQPTGGAQPPLPNFLQELGFTDAFDLDDRAVQQTVVPQVKRTLAETRHQSLATMVMMGINRIVVEEGEINAKLIFSIEANEETTVTFNDQKTTNWGMAGTMGRNPFGASGIVVTTTNVNTQSDINMRAELTGEVRVKFKSDYFPLERFADSAAIQLINNYARPVPPPKADDSEAGQENATSQSLSIRAAPLPEPDPDDRWSIRAPEERP